MLASFVSPFVGLGTLAFSLGPWCGASSTLAGGASGSVGGRLLQGAATSAWMASVVDESDVALRTGERSGFASTLLTSLGVVPLLFPVHVAQYTPGYWSVQYVVDDGLLRPSGLATWEDFDGWDEDEGTPRLHAGGLGSNRFGRETARPDREAAPSLFAEHLERHD